MKNRLKHALQLQQEAQSAMKGAAIAQAAGFPEQASALQLEATFYDAAALTQLQPGALRQVVAGEAVPVETDLPDSRGGWAVRNTLATPDTPAVAASLTRTELLAQSNLDVLALGVDAAASAGCDDSLTKMLVHQAGLAHAATFKLIDRAMDQASTVETARLVNSAARMMSTFQQALLTLHRLKNGGQQTVTVQHINVNADQAVVAGLVQTGGHPTSKGGKSEK